MIYKKVLKISGITSLILSIGISGYGLLDFALVDDLWHTDLPTCPCEIPNLNTLNDGWARDVGDINKYHPGSTHCIRSFPPVETSAGLSGQQCCYDENGLLITEGAAAGTPDKSATCLGEKENGDMKVRKYGVFLHMLRDVIPWKIIGWEKYNQKWAPSIGECPENKR